MTIFVSACQQDHLPLVDEMETKVVLVDRHRVFDERVQVTILLSVCERTRLPLVDKWETKVVSVDRH